MLVENKKLNAFSLNISSYQHFTMIIIISLHIIKFYYLKIKIVCDFKKFNYKKKKRRKIPVF